MQEVLRRKIIIRWIGILTNNDLESDMALDNSAIELFKDIKYIALIRPFVIKDIKLKKLKCSQIAIKYGVSYKQIERIKNKLLTQ